MSLSGSEFQGLLNLAQRAATGDISCRAEITADLIHAYETGNLGLGEIGFFLEEYRRLTTEP